MNKKREDEILKYIAGKMTEEEKVDFITRVENDPGLQEEVAFWLGVEEGFEFAEGKERKKEKKGKSGTWLIYLALAIILSLLLVFWEDIFQKPDYQYEKYDVQCVVSAGRNDSKSVTNEQMIYRSADSLYNEGIQMYWRKKDPSLILQTFDLAKTKCYELIPKESPSNCCDCQILYWKGVINFEKGNMDLAIDYLENIVRYKDKAEIGGPCQDRINDAEKILKKTGLRK